EAGWTGVDLGGPPAVCRRSGRRRARLDTRSFRLLDSTACIPPGPALAGLTSGRATDKMARLLPADYVERVYAGVLGKMIGVYLGRPFEGWTHERILAELGPIEDYVHDRLGLP